MRPDDRYDSLIRYNSELNNLDWLMVKAQIKQESLFDPEAKSHVGAAGLMQFMPPTWAEWAPKDQNGGLCSVFNPEANIDAGCRYMRWLLARFEQDVRKALAAYNWGIGNLRRHLTNHDSPWMSRLPAETQTYLRKINEYYVDYQHERLKKWPT